MTVAGRWHLVIDFAAGAASMISNELIFKDGKLYDVIVNVTSDKAKAVKNIIAEWRMKKEDIVVVVDGANDLKLF